MYRHYKGRTIINPKGVEYFAKIKELTREHVEKNGTLNSKLSVFIEVFTPDRLRRDLDNIFKCLLDALTKAGVYADDSLIWELSAKKCGVDPLKNGFLKIHIGETE